MITCQQIEISWTKEARGGRLATVRNAIPYAFEISSDRKSLTIEKYISVIYESMQVPDNATNKLISVVGNLIFEIENNILQVKIPRYNGYDQKLASLNPDDTIQFMKFSTSIDYEHTITYHKWVVNMAFSNGNISSDYFQTQPFKYQFDEKSGIWY
ncbi:hypothetical protein [Emticicia agri]|uniref:Uncharacterized protein n=1 Tax=Emticicia agri TaxID=2492393 RepID=A0A4Q5LVP4_9BACT|nr:hypothetical protein [Emticicia agri]RYU93635.1 hypothetical protein EWM59_21115 [Emticicia agri]